MLLVQKFLQEHSFTDLIKNHGVYASLSKDKKKISLNYDQIETKDDDQLSWDCRGLILSKLDNKPFSLLNDKLDLDCVPGATRIIAFGMKRFFNFGQGSATINWSDPNLSVLDKLDGTLTQLYYDVNTIEWCVSTRSVPDADLLMDNGIFTFRTLFEKALFDTVGLSFTDYTAQLNPEITYCFELTTPYNRIVVYYPNCRITLIAARHIKYIDNKLVSFNELDISSLESYGVPKVKSHTFITAAQLIDWVGSFNPMEQEGVVLLDGQFNRIKVKNPGYVAYNKLNDRLGASERNCVELILLEKDDDVIGMLPEEIAKNLIKLKLGIQKMIRKYDDFYQLVKSKADLTMPGDKKTFALLINQNKDLWSAPLFQMYDQKVSDMLDFIKKNCQDGTWGNNFLDKVLECAKKENC